MSQKQDSCFHEYEHDLTRSTNKKLIVSKLHFRQY